MKLNVIIGRFQPLHEEHVRLIQYALDTADQTLVLIGCSDEDGSSKKNPFTFEERASLINDHFLGNSLITLPLKDVKCDDSWVELVAQTIERIASQEENEITFVCCNKDSSTTASNNLLKNLFPIKYLEATQNLNATEIRNKFFNGDLKYITCIPHVTQQFLAQTEHQLIQDCEVVVTLLTAGETSITTAIRSADLPFTEWKLSYLYSYIDQRLVACFKCGEYKTPQQFGYTTTQEVFETLVVCRCCQGVEND